MMAGVYTTFDVDTGRLAEALSELSVGVSDGTISVQQANFNEDIDADRPEAEFELTLRYVAESSHDAAIDPIHYEDDG